MTLTHWAAVMVLSGVMFLAAMLSPMARVEES